MCSAMVSQVLGLGEILITGTRGWPTTFPCPVVKKWSTLPPATAKVIISAAALEESMNTSPSPGPTGSAGLSTFRTGRVPVFWMLPRAFSSMVVRPPRMLPSVGWEPRRSTPLASIMAT